MIPKYLCIDIENDNTNRYKRNAGNFQFDKIVCIGYTDGNIHRAEYTSNRDFIMQLVPNSVSILVGHNIKHDLLFLWGSERLQYMLQQGLKIWDTQLAEYYLSSFQNTYPKLRDIAVQKYGCAERPKHIDNLLFSKEAKETYRKESLDELHCKLKALEFWDMCNECIGYDCECTNFNSQFRGYMDQVLANELSYKIKNTIIPEKQVSDLPIELVLEDVKNDVLDTENIFLKQWQECEKRAILKVIELQNEALLATVEMEYNGFNVNREKLEENESDLKWQLDNAKLNLNYLIVDYWNMAFPFDYRSRTDLPLLLFGGQKKTIEKKPILDENGCPTFVKTGLNKGQIKLKNQEVMHEIKGLGLTLQGHWQTDKGNPSINEAVLQEIISTQEKKTLICDQGNGGLDWLTDEEVDNYKRDLRNTPKYKVTPAPTDAVKEIAQLLLDIRGLEKSISTYYESFKELIYETDGCIHGKFNHVSTITGRLSSQDPNLQNLPRKGSSKVKEHFVSRFEDQFDWALAEAFKRYSKK